MYASLFYHLYQVLVMSGLILAQCSTADESDCADEA